MTLQDLFIEHAQKLLYSCTSNNILCSLTFMNMILFSLIYALVADFINETGSS